MLFAESLSDEKNGAIIALIVSQIVILFRWWRKERRTDAEVDVKVKNAEADAELDRDLKRAQLEKNQWENYGNEIRRRYDEDLREKNKQLAELIVEVRGLTAENARLTERVRYLTEELRERDERTEKGR